MVTPSTNRQEWLFKRMNGIGASEAACILGLNPFKSNVQLWKEKTGKVEAPDISNNAAVAYGKAAEQHIRELFKLHYPKYDVAYDEFGMISNCSDVPFAFATLDGELTDTENWHKGILEIKTAQPRNSTEWAVWRDGVPQHYFIQILHQFLATEYSFAVLCAELRLEDGEDLKFYTRHYYFNRSDYLDDIEYLKNKEIEFWNCVISTKQPSLILPQI